MASVRTYVVLGEVVDIGDQLLLDMRFAFGFVIEISSIDIIFTWKARWFSFPWSTATWGTVAVQYDCNDFRLFTRLRSELMLHPIQVLIQHSKNKNDLLQHPFVGVAVAEITVASTVPCSFTPQQSSDVAFFRSTIYLKRSEGWYSVSHKHCFTVGYSTKHGISTVNENRKHNFLAAYWANVLWITETTVRSRKCLNMQILSTNILAITVGIR